MAEPTGNPGPKVSVVIITYNHAEFIAQAIEGALMQETDFPYEIIIGEDESNDRTREICIDYAERYTDRIRLFLRSRKDVIYVGGRPTGKFNYVESLKAARGQYIALCEGDDYWTDRLKLQKQVDFLQAHPECSMCFHRVLVVSEDGRLDSRELGPRHCKETYSLEDYLQADMLQTGSIVYRRDALPELPEWIFQAPIGDWALVALLGQQGYLGYLDQVLGVYRIHAGGTWSSQTRLTRLGKRLQTLQLISEHLEDRYRRVIESRCTGLAVAASKILAQQEMRSVRNGRQVSGPTAVMQRSGVTGAASGACEAMLLKEFYTTLFFALHEAGRRAEVRSCLRHVVRHNPSLLGNLGVWSIATEAVLGRRVAGRIKYAARAVCRARWCRHDAGRLRPMTKSQEGRDPFECE